MVAPTDTYALLHWNMVNAHQTFKLGYDIILKQLTNPPTHDLQNFLGYCEAWATSIEHHHNSEEEVVFPFLNEKMDFSGEANQHKVIHETLDRFSAMISEAKKDTSKFDVATWNSLMAEFREPLYTHLDEEVEHILPSKLKDAGFAEKDVLKMNSQLEAYAKSHGDPFLIVPYMRSHTAADHKDTWPPMPWLLRKVLVPYLLAKKHSGYWKYAPYPMS